jgi:GNAT superfamily N-acetyltransferase
MALVSYIFLRGLELEGRHPHDVGAWPLTVRRLEVGEGIPSPLDPASMIEVPSNEPFPPAPKLPPARRVRFFYYRRIRSSAECERHIQIVEPEVPVSVELFAAWGNPQDGAIAMPAEGELPLENTHLVVLRACSTERREFEFQNTWGNTWGKDGCGFISYDYIDKYAFESWVTYFRVIPESHKLTRAHGRQDRRWVVRDEWYRRIYGFELWDEAGQDRRAWTFVLEKDGVLEIEELYVRPEFRRQGYGRVLTEKVREVARAKEQPLRLWVPFADCRQEDPSNYPALIAVARLLGLQFQPCPVIWAAYFATNERPGEALPVEPARIPARPKSTLEAVLAMAVALGTHPASNGLTAVVQPAVAGGRAEFPAVGTERWGIMNRKRAELIRKKNRQGLTPEEQREYERLQRLSQAALEQAFPPPPAEEERLKQLEARLRTAPEASSE